MSLNMWLIKKSIQKIFKKNVKWTSKDKFYNNHVIFIKQKIRKIYIKKISMHFINQLFIWWCFIF
jgi:hypothetical protein